MSPLIILIILASVCVFAAVHKKMARKTSAISVGPFFLASKDWMFKTRNFIVANNSPHAVEVRGANLVLITHPDGVKALLREDTTEFEKGHRFPSGTPIGDLFNNGLVGVKGDDWRRQRTAIAPALNYDYIRSMVPIFVEQTKVLVSILGEKQEDANMRMWFTKLTLDILGAAAFGFQFNVLTNKEGLYSKAYSALSSIEFPVLESIFPFLAKIPTPSYKKKQTLAKLVEELNMKMIEGKKKEMAELVIDRQKDLLDALVGSTELNVQELHNNMWTFFVAGHETTATALSWEINFLAKHQDHQQKIYEEIMANVGDRDPVQEDIKNLPFLEMFVKEVLRICPPVPMLTGRVATEAKEIDGLIIPAGTRITNMIYTIHHLPEFWPEPEKFDPYRFSPENSKGRHPYCYLPFSLGRRHCVGNMFSLLEQKIILIILIQKYRIKYICEVDARTDVVYTPRSVHVSLEARN